MRSMNVVPHAATPFAATTPQTAPSPHVDAPSISPSDATSSPAPRPRLFIPRDHSDYLFWLAIVTLPIDGTVLGFFQPFWTPISPWCLVAYCLANPRLLLRTLRRYAPFVALPVVLVALSVKGWMIFGLHPVATVMSLSGVIAVPAAMCALDIALTHKKLDWSGCVSTVIAVYWFAFTVGIVQWLAMRLSITSINSFFVRLLYRAYGTGGWWAQGGHGRPQFLFAEPSYIGMHLFGVLLPLLWLMRSRDKVLARHLRILIVVFAVGAVLMGSGTRILLDSVIALVIAILVHITWHKPLQFLRGVGELLATVAFGTGGIMLNSRLDSILNNGLEGDGSFFMRIWQPLAPLCGLLHRPWTLLTGYGAGNITDATLQGADKAIRILQRLHTDSSNASAWYASRTHDNIWTMSIYVNLITEYGFTALLLLIAITLWFIIHTRRTVAEYTRLAAHARLRDTERNATDYVEGTDSDASGVHSRHSTSRAGGYARLTNRIWTKTLVCWLLLLIYLYVQFEGYAFIAFPLFIWSAGHAYDRPLSPLSNPNSLPLPAYEDNGAPSCCPQKFISNADR